MKSLVVVLAALTLVSCSRDPNVAKKRYLENGNRYFAKGKFKEASIMYRNALQKDQRYGSAYYHLALTDMKLGRVPNALGELRRAIELIPKDQPEHLDAEVRLAEIYVAFTRESQFLTEVDGIVKDLLQRDPNSYDGHRLTADLDFVRAQASLHEGHQEEGEKLRTAAIAEYRKAMSLKTPGPALKMQLARALAGDRQFPEAEQAYRQLIDENKTLVEAYNELYRVYLVQNKTADAEQVLKAGAANNPKQVGFLLALARHYATLHRRDDMVATLNQIKGHAKDFERAYLVVGDFYLRSGEVGEALNQYKEGMAADPKQKTTYQKRMIETLMRQNKRAEAADINAAILKSNPKDSDARGLQATLLLDRGEVQKAISELQAVVNAAPDNFVARYNLGRAHIARGEMEQARQQFTEAIRLRPDYVSARLALAQLQVMRSEYEPALKSIAEILRIDKRNAPARMIEAAALMGEKRFDDAQKVLEALQQANPGSDVDFSLGMLAMKQGHLIEAEAIFRKGYAAHPKDGRDLVGLVEVLAAQGHFDQGIQALQAEVSRNPNRNDLRVALGNLAVRAGKYDLAIGQFQTVLAALDKNSSARGDIYFRLGETLRKKGDLKNSIQYLYQARQALPVNSLVVEELALALQFDGRKPEARDAYEQAIKLDPQNGMALNNLAFLMADAGFGDLDTALTYAQRAKQALPNLTEVSDTLGWIYLKKNMSDNAMDVFQTLVTQKPDNPTYRFHLGMAYAQKGDKPKAL
ncbi:MAG: tetratricopeptide repeat protein, partial [Bryobacteraceae bacterium]